MADELIDVVDENNKPMNLQMMKSEAHEKHLWHRASHVWIYNSKKELLLQLRKKDREIHSGSWDISCAGHLSAGETPAKAAVREAKEELGLDIKKEDLKFIKIKKSSSEAVNRKTGKHNYHYHFCYVYVMKSDKDISQLKLQKEEVEKVKLFSIEELRNDIISGKADFAKDKEYWFEIIDIINKDSEVNHGKKK